MSKQDENNRSKLYYFTLSALLSLLAVAALSQGHAAEPDPASGTDAANSLKGIELPK